MATKTPDARRTTGVLGSPGKLTGKVALVTGAGRRVGQAIAIAMARAGADIVIHWNTSRAGAQETARKVNALGRRSFAVQADLRDAVAIQEMVEAADRRMGGLDALVNSASTFGRTPFAEITQEMWDDILRVNLTGAFLLAQAAAPLLANRHGSIVNICDVIGQRPLRGYVHHATSKAALAALTLGLALELAPKVRCNGVAPGTVLPPDSLDEAEKTSILAKIPADRFGTPDDVAAAVVYLATAPFVTGVILPVDGGRLLT